MTVFEWVYLKVARLNFLCFEAEQRLREEITVNYRKIEKITFLHTQVSSCEICVGSNDYRQPGVSKISRTDRKAIVGSFFKLSPDLCRNWGGQWAVITRRHGEVNSNSGCTSSLHLREQSGLRRQRKLILPEFSDPGPDYSLWLARRKQEAVGGVGILQTPHLFPPPPRPRGAWRRESLDINSLIFQSWSLWFCCRPPWEIIAPARWPSFSTHSRVIWSRSWTLALYAFSSE